MISSKTLQPQIQNC